MDVSVAILCYAAGSSMPPLTCLTDDDSAVAGAPSPLPKFLLPLAGRTPLALLLEATAKAGIPRSRVHLLCSPDTRQEVESAVESMKSTDRAPNTPPPAAASSETAAASSPSSSPLHLHTLSSACSGTASAVRHLSSLPSPSSPSSPLVPPSHHLLVLPADVLLEDPATLPRLCNDHLSADPKAAATVLLRDVGAEDEEGRPIKESKKGKLGLLQREADKIDVVGLVKPAKGVPRLVLKRSRVEIDEGEENVGETPKLEVPKSMLRAALAGPSPGALSVRTDLLDLHCFVLSPWAWRSLLASKACKPMDSVQSEFLPHLIAAQQAPAAEAYGDAEGDGGAGAIPPSSVEGLALPAPADPFCVAASVLARPEKGKSAALHVRVNSVANYAYACREAVANAIRKVVPGSVIGNLPGTVNARDNTILGSESKKGTGGSIKNSTIGASVSIGAKCKILNCILMDGVKVGNGCILQNSILCKGAVLGDSVNLSDVHVPYGIEVAGGTKAKGELDL